MLKDRFLTNEKPDNLYVTALLYFVVFFLSFLLIFVCFFQLCQVKQNSMNNTLHNGDHVLLLKVGKSYKRGDIVVITKDEQRIDENGNAVTIKTNIIKRVIAVGGDTIKFTIDETDGQTVHLYRKNKSSDEYKLLKEKYIAEPMNKDSAGFSQMFDGFEFDKDIVLDKGFLFVMGDNRNSSMDSRKDGPYPVQSVYGKKVLFLKKNSILEFLLKLLFHENNSATGVTGEVAVKYTGIFSFPEVALPKKFVFE